MAKAGGDDARPSPAKKHKRPAPKRPGSGQRVQRSAVVEHFAPASVAGVIQESKALEGALIYFVPSYRRAARSKAELEAIVARLGGKVGISMPRQLSCLKLTVVLQCHACADDSTVVALCSKGQLAGTVHPLVSYTRVSAVCASPSSLWGGCAGISELHRQGDAHHCAER